MRSIKNVIIRKFMLVLLAAALLLPGINPSCVNAAKNEGTVHIEIDFLGNFLFNKYDVDCYLDDEFLETIPHGEDLYTDIELAFGNHTLYFYKYGDGRITATQSFEISSTESTISLDLSVDGDEIHLRNFDIRDDAAIAAQEAKEKEEAERKAREEQERQELEAATANLCVAAPGDDKAIKKALKVIGDRNITFDGYIAYASRVNKKTVALIRCGRADDKTITGPDFQIICRKLSAIPYTSEADLKVKRGLHLTVEARVKGYDKDTNIVSLEPVGFTSIGSKLIVPDAVDTNSAEAVKAVQTALNNEGFDCGTPDGKAGKRTRAAISQYKTAHHLSENTDLDEELITYLRVQPAIEQALAEKAAAEKAAVRAAAATEKSKPTYIGNANSKKFHYPGCSSVGDMKESNKVRFYGSRDEVIQRGYVPCKRCNP